MSRPHLFALLSMLLGGIGGLCSAGPALATPGVGDLLPAIEIDHCGELFIKNQQIVYRPWTTGGAPALVHFTAARWSVVNDNKDEIRRAIESRPQLKPFVVTVLNSGDALWGTAGLIQGWVEKSKLERPRVRLVLDCEQKLKEAWGLPERASMILLLDSQQRVRFVQVNTTPDADLSRLLAEVARLDLTPDVAAR